MLTKTRHVAGSNGQTTEVRERRAGGQDGLGQFVRLSRHLPVGDGGSGALGPVGRTLSRPPEDLARQKEIRSRKSRMDQRTRERLLSCRSSWLG